VARLDFGGVDSCFPAAVSLRQRELEGLLEADLEVPVERGAAVELVRQGDDGLTARFPSRAAITRGAGRSWTPRWKAGRTDPASSLCSSTPTASGPCRCRVGSCGSSSATTTRASAPEVADGQAVIDRHLPGGARISSAENCACFSLHHRVAARFRSGRVLLAGDAAHAMTPVSGQQLTAGHHAVLPRCDLGHDLPRGHDLTFHNNVNLCSGRNSPPPATPRAPGSS
jgi:FAD binding domain